MRLSASSLLLLIFLLLLFVVLFLFFSGAVVGAFRFFCNVSGPPADDHVSICEGDTHAYIGYTLLTFVPCTCTPGKHETDTDGWLVPGRSTVGQELRRRSSSL